MISKIRAKRKVFNYNGLTKNALTITELHRRYLS